MLLWTAALDSFAMQLPLCRWRCQRGFANAGKGNHDLSDDPAISCLESFTLHTFRQPEHGNIQYAEQWVSVCSGGLVYSLWKCRGCQLLPAPHSAMLLPSVTLLVSIFTAPAISRPFVLRPDSVFLDSYLRAFGEPSHDHWFISDITFSHFCVQITSCHLGTICSY